MAYDEVKMELTTKTAQELKRDFQVWNNNLHDYYRGHGEAIINCKNELKEKLNEFETYEDFAVWFENIFLKEIEVVENE